MSKRIMGMLPGLILYVAAGLLAIYAIWSFAYCADIIAQARAAGQLAAGGNEYDITSFYMSNCGLYFALALLLAAAGLLLQRKPPEAGNPDTGADYAEDNAGDAEYNAGDAELDEWFDEETTDAH